MQQYLSVHTSWKMNRLSSNYGSIAILSRPAITPFATSSASCMAGYEGRCGWINYLAFAPAHQQRGFARQIMHQAEELLHSAGCPRVNLMVRVTNSAVIDFHKHIGYEEARLANLGKRLTQDEPYRQD